MAFSVLIVDDCPAMQTVIRRILGISGFDLEACYFAADGSEALSMLRRHTVDLVISDVNMPRLDGEGMLRCLAEDEELRKVPVVMVSSDGTRSRVDRLVGMGAKGYVVKPFQPAVLRAELERVLEASNV